MTSHATRATLRFAVHRPTSAHDGASTGCASAAGAGASRARSATDRAQLILQGWFDGAAPSCLTRKPRSSRWPAPPRAVALDAAFRHLLGRRVAPERACLVPATPVGLQRRVSSRRLSRTDSRRSRARAPFDVDARRSCSSTTSYTGQRARRDHEPSTSASGPHRACLLIDRGGPASCRSALLRRAAEVAATCPSSCHATPTARAHGRRQQSLMRNPSSMLRRVTPFSAEGLASEVLRTSSHRRPVRVVAERR